MSNDIFLGGTIRPGTTDSVFEDTDGKGGLRVVATVSARNAITTLYKKQGMLVYVIADDTYYKLLSDLSTWVPFTAGGSGSGALVARATSTTNVASLSGTGTFDGVALIVDDLIFLSNTQTSAVQRGLWQIKSGAWVRPTTFATGGHAANTLVYTQEGATLGDRLYQCTTDPPADIIDTDPLSFKFVVDAGFGILVSSGQIAINVAANFTGGNAWSGNHDFGGNVGLGTAPANIITFGGRVTGDINFTASTTPHVISASAAAASGDVGTGIIVRGGSAGAGTGALVGGAGSSVFAVGRDGGTNGGVGGGIGGAVSSFSGNGAAGSGATAGMVGGLGSMYAGDGGAGTGGGGVAGDGGAIVILAGDGGVDGGSGGGAGGSVTVDTGLRTGASTKGALQLGMSFAGSVVLGNTANCDSTTINSGGSYVSRAGTTQKWQNALGGITIFEADYVGFSIPVLYLGDTAPSLISLQAPIGATAGASYTTHLYNQHDHTIQVDASGAGVGHTLNLRAGAAFAGAGGPLIARGGDGGPGATSGGNAILDSGVGGTGLGGIAAIGTTFAESVSIGRIGKPINILGDLSFTTLLPALDNTYDLGSTTFRWRTIHLGPTSCVVHNDTTNEKKISVRFSGAVAQLFAAARTTTSAVGTDLSVLAGDGGVSSGAAVGGAGGLLELRPGVGGDGSGAFGGGDAGDLNLTGSLGGTGTAGAPSGKGSTVFIIAGSAGINGGGGYGVTGVTSLRGGVGLNAVGSSPASEGGEVGVHGGPGGNASTGALGGLGGEALVNSGRGGHAAGAFVGRKAGAVRLLASNGGNSSASAAAGAGGDILVICGDSGDNSLGGGPAQGGSFTATAGNGGVADTTHPGGAAGDFTFGGGSTGGDGSASQPSGPGGNVFFFGSPAGANGGAGAGAAGTLQFTGAAGRNAVSGSVAGAAGAALMIAGAGGAGFTGSLGSVGANAEVRGGAGGAGTTSVVGRVAGSGVVRGGIGGAGSSAKIGGLGGSAQLLGQIGGANNGFGGGGGGSSIMLGGFGVDGSGSVAGTLGGLASVTGGDGGAGTATAAAGDGANVTLAAGFAGAANGGPGGAGGSIFADGGLGSGGGDGTVFVGFTSGGVRVGRIGAKTHIVPPFTQDVGSTITVSGTNQTISPTRPIHPVSGTIADSIQTINVPYSGFTGGRITLIPLGTVLLVTGGNIALAATMVVSKMLDLEWDGTSWYPSYTA